ncbi:murein transglycosylase A [Variovorax dokdonensis]|uniref:peptidoglycan lytic exotransglycosylase n=1 Tax=Variovorax dokdonensis TaxID=344883 RepID=A0ABT7NAJ3_9BURK|nr:murein transglycosylase A [Variovorax dokdonensis]MDM0044949.1 murein transglycosylase A [Variovorax dokdonensis]
MNTHSPLRPQPGRAARAGTAVATGALAALLAGCTLMPSASDEAAPASTSNAAGSRATTSTTTPVSPAPADSTMGARPAPSAATRPPPPAPISLGGASRPAGRTSSSAAGPGANVAGESRTFSTQLATYTSVGYDKVPGWVQDDFSETWPAFLTSCKVMNRRGAEWKQICDRASTVDGRSNAAIRNFFEAEFSAYQIRDDDRRPDGVVTGYFEPEIAGSRNYAPPFIYPVYGQPQDMLFLDGRKIPAGSTSVPARIQGNQVIPQAGLSTRDLGAAGIYVLELSDITRDTLDRKIRLRAEGRRLLPYYTRQEIESRGAPNAKVLAFVDNAMALYEMQIQGSGRIRLNDGEVIRLSYAEQNGQPFRPTLAKNSKGKTQTAVRTRGGAVELVLDEEDDDGGFDTSVIRVRGFTLAKPTVMGAVAVPGQRTSASAKGSGIQDPSYVFFKESTSTAGGPVGAFGVPLEPGRSIAVDPRATPLGYPVFVSTTEPVGNKPMQRLTVAQDTGGAIRGAVRADYFFGNGTQAASQARRMKERGQLWVLLPRGLPVAAASGGAIRTRGGAVGDGLPQCLVEEEGLCVDD